MRVAITAYGIAKKHGFTGTEQEWLEMLHPEFGTDFVVDDNVVSINMAETISVADDRPASAKLVAQSIQNAVNKAVSDTQASAEEVDAMIEEVLTGDTSEDEPGEPGEETNGEGE